MLGGGEVASSKPLKEVVRKAKVLRLAGYDADSEIILCIVTNSDGLQPTTQ